MLLVNGEYFEAYIGLVYGMFVGDNRETSPAMRAYGTVSAFSTRLDMVTAAAEAYYVMFPDDKISNEFDELYNYAKSFATRRNEMAHGIVQTYFTDRLEPNCYALGPSRHATRKKKLINEAALPKILIEQYAYTSVELEYFRSHFERLAKAAEAIYVLLHSEVRKRRQASPPREA